MSASLGSTTYTAVSWATGDIITEAKLDNMVLNDQAYDSHESNGLLLANNKSFAGKNTGGTSYNLAKINASNALELGDSDFSGDINTENNPLKRGQAYQDLEVASDGATVTFDMSKSNLQTVTLGGDRTLALSNVKVGQIFNLQLKQDVTGSRTVTWFTTISWVDGTAPTLITTGGKTDSFGFICTDTNQYQGYVIGQNI